MGRRRIKGNMDIELAIDMLEMAQYIDHAILFSGDGDFRRLVEAVQRTRGPRLGGVDYPLLAANGFGRSAASGRQFHRAAGAGAEHYAQPSHARGATTVREPKRSTRRDDPTYRRPCRHANCPLCPRLAAFRETQRAAHPEWFNAPVPSFGDDAAELLIVGLAPGLRGANRTGRPFTGDYAGGLLYQTLAKIRLRRGQIRCPSAMTGWRCAGRVSPTRCAAFRRKTSPSPAKSRLAGAFSLPR